MKAIAFFIPEDDSFKKFVIFSVTLHVALFAGFTIKNILLPNETIFIPDAIRVDMVALPDKPTDAPAPVSTPLAKTDPIVETKPKNEKQIAVKEPVKDFKDTQKKALEKLNQKSAIDKIMKEVSSDKEKAETKPKKFAGNYVTSGDSFSGMDKLKTNEYLSTVKATIHERWVLPQFLSNANLKATIVIAVDSQGALTKKEILSSSGNSIFDGSCIAAVENSAPFASPPDNLKDVPFAIRFPFE